MGVLGMDGRTVDLKEIRSGDVDWIDLAGPMAVSCEHGNEP
jgi:hypothetical protein